MGSARGGTGLRDGTSTDAETTRGDFAVEGT
jgi:hypothetical protein